MSWVSDPPPEVNLARRLTEKEKLVPPIDILNLAKKFASVKRLPLPFDVDGLCVDIKQLNKKPRIFVSNLKSRERMRFTLAHELGHVLIPWHMGTILDDIDPASDANDKYREIENEANRFASELLMPTSWVKEQIKGLQSPIKMTETVAASADVSFQAATFKVLSVLKSNYIFAQIKNGGVISSGRSEGTLANQPAVGRTVAPSDLFPWTRARWQAQIGDTEYYWWQFTGTVAIPKSSKNVPWRETLNEIVDSLFSKDKEKQKFKQTINGMVSYANGRIKEDRTVEKIYDACLQRFYSVAPRDQSIRKFSDHPKFEEFLFARISDLIK